jgi:hypothetical protein
VLLLLLEEQLADLQDVALELGGAGLVGGDGHQLEVQRGVEDLDVRLVGLVGPGRARSRGVVAARGEEDRRAAGDRDS